MSKSKAQALIETFEGQIIENHFGDINKMVELGSTQGQPPRPFGASLLWLQAPLDPLDLQVFAEGLVAVSRLDVLNGHRIAEGNVADKETRHD